MVKKNEERKDIMEYLNLTLMNLTKAIDSYEVKEHRHKVEQSLSSISWSLKIIAEKYTGK